MQKHVVVDGSNIATEGRPYPSLKQLNEAVLAYLDEHPDTTVTVVVDATFGHRIDPSEVPEFDAAIDNNELVSPPAGAIGRGDAFVLTIANKAQATVLSNDSFQEFHGEYPWLFDEGRLVGGKPVPHVGWVFVDRAPVRGPVSRRAVKAKKDGRKPAEARPSKRASEPMPVPKLPPPSGRRAKATAAAATAPATGSAVAEPKPAARGQAAAAPSKQAALNELLPFLTFVEQHPVGSPVRATVDSYSSHGAYTLTDGVRCYVPLRHLGHPAPRSAREVVALGDERDFVVVSFNPSRRGIDLALPEFVPAGVVLLPAASTRAASGRRKKAATAPEAAPAPAVEATPSTGRRTKRAAAESGAVAEVAVAAVAGVQATKARGKKATPAPATPAPETPAGVEVPPRSRAKASKALAAADTSKAPPEEAPGSRRRRAGSGASVDGAVAPPVATPATKAEKGRKVAAPPPEAAPPTRKAAGRKPATPSETAAAPSVSRGKKAAVPAVEPAPAAAKRGSRTGTTGSPAPRKGKDAPVAPAAPGTPVGPEVAAAPAPRTRRRR